MDCFSYAYESLNAESYSMQLQSEINRFLATESKNRLSAQGKSLFYRLIVFPGGIPGWLLQKWVMENCCTFRKIGCRIAIDSDQLMTYAPQLAVAVGLGTAWK